MKKIPAQILLFIFYLCLFGGFNLFIFDVVRLIYDSDLHKSIQQINLKMIEKIQTMNLQKNLKSRMTENLNILMEQFQIDGLEVFLEQDKKFWKTGTMSQEVGQGNKTFFDANRGVLDFSWKIYSSQTGLSASGLTKFLQMLSFVLFGLYCLRLIKMFRYGEPQHIEAVNRYFEDAKIELPESFEPLNQFRSELTKLRRQNEDLQRRCELEEQHCYYFRPEYLQTDRIVGQLINSVKTLINSGADYQIMVNMLSDLYLLLLQSWTNDCVSLVFEENNSLRWNHQTFNVMGLMLECHAVFENYAKQQQLSLILEKELLQQEEIVGDAHIMHHLFITWLFSLLELATEKSKIHWGLQIQKEHHVFFLSISHPQHFYTLDELTQLAQSFESGKKLYKKFGQKSFNRAQFFCAVSTFFMQQLKLQNCKVFREVSTLRMQIPIPIPSYNY